MCTNLALLAACLSNLKIFKIDPCQTLLLNLSSNWRISSLTFIFLKGKKQNRNNLVISCRGHLRLNIIVNFQKNEGTLIKNEFHSLDNFSADSSSDKSQKVLLPFIIPAKKIEISINIYPESDAFNFGSKVAIIGFCFTHQLI